MSETAVHFAKYPFLH
jgi:hypothetical protein